jgi:hypothetical protein
LLRTEGPATATSLAARLGLNSGATSYHLRQLAAHGFVVEDTGRGSRRDRWWRAAQQRTSFDSTTFEGDVELDAAHLRSVAQVHSERMLRAVDERPTIPPTWQRVVGMSDYLLRLTPEEAIAMVSEISAVIERYRENDPDSVSQAPEDAVPVSFQFQTFPQFGPQCDTVNPDHQAETDADVDGR